MNKNTYSTSTEKCKPSLDHIERLRSTRLHQARRNIKHTINYYETHNQEVNTRDHNFYLKHVVLLVAEIAILNRSSPSDDHSEYLHLIDDTVNVDPWDIEAAWKEHALPHIEAASRAWAEHIAQAMLRSEPKKFKHQHVIDLANISGILALSREFIRIIFEDEKCVLPPVKVQASRFDADTRKRLRELAKITVIQAERLGDILLERGEAGLLAYVEEKRAKHEARIARLFLGKPGPKPKPDTLTQKVIGTAKQLRIHPSTVWRHMAAQPVAETIASDGTIEVDIGDQIVTINAPAPVNSTPEFRVFDTPGNVTLRVEICNVESEFAEGDSGISTLFSQSPDNASNDYNPAMYRLAETAMAYTKKNRKKYADKEVIREWYLATTGKVLTDGNLRIWKFRGQYQKHQEKALAWKVLNRTATINEADRKVVSRITRKEMAS